MLILLAAYQKCFQKKRHLSDMKYDVKTSEMAFFVNYVTKCMSKCFCFEYFYICKTNN